MSSYSGKNSYSTGKGYSNSKYANREPMIGSLDFWIRSADDWEKETKGNEREHGGKSGKRRGYGKNVDYRKKRSTSRVRFPVRQIKNIRDFPLRKFHSVF